MKTIQPTDNFTKTITNEIRKKLRRHTNNPQFDANACDICCCELKALLEDNLTTINSQPAIQQLEIAMAFYQSVSNLKSILPASCEALNLYTVDITEFLNNVVNAINQGNDEEAKAQLQEKFE